MDYERHMTQPTASQLPDRHVSDKPDQPAPSHPVTDHRQMVRPQKDPFNLAQTRTAQLVSLLFLSTTF